MKIGIDIRTLMDSRYSGVSEYTLNLVKEILKLDHVNRYRLFYNSAKDISGRMPEFNYSNVKIVKKNIPNKFLNYFLFKYLNWPKVDKMLDADMFFMPHINFIALSGKSKNILTIHDLSFLRFPEYFSFRKNFWHKMINIKKLIHKFNTIITVSENTKNDVVELCGVNPENVKVIYSGVEGEYNELSSEASELSSFKRKYDLPDKFIFFLGTVEPRKNIEGLISAYNKFRENRETRFRVPETEFQLVIAGGKGWKSDSIYNEWKKSKYKDDIKFLGYVNKKDKVYLYNLASLFVYPSFYEGFGFPPLEAMACGTPVITSFTSSLPEIVGDAGIMVDPYNITDIATAIEQVLSDSELRDNLIQKGLERVKRFNWEKTAGEYLGLLKELRG
jgi:glycosyltransferase involved in cell wall biosynthesis